MSLTKSRGNMYPWVSHTHAHLGGRCPHLCCYCYVENPRFGRPLKYTGQLRMLPGELDVRYGEGKTIFIDHCNDLWAEDVPHEYIQAVLDHCARWPKNVYVYQTKNPGRFLQYINMMLPNCILGTTIETNRDIRGVSKAPRPISRFVDITQAASSRQTFITIEPVLDFDMEEFSQYILMSTPAFVNIGADSKGHGLQEPTCDKVMSLIDTLFRAGIEIRGKHNLGRLIGEQNLADVVARAEKAKAGGK